MKQPEALQRMRQLLIESGAMSKSMALSFKENIE